mmetsp:Transcript_79169/g.245892  ORF Transcript_79169/g.245892 Transcript_79169/m.245892 type:complete len:214 (-) Transcript_79169:372-1013(-)
MQLFQASVPYFVWHKFLVVFAWLCRMWAESSISHHRAYAWRDWHGKGSGHTAGNSDGSSRLRSGLRLGALQPPHLSACGLRRDGIALRRLCHRCRGSRSKRAADRPVRHAGDGECRGCGRHGPLCPGGGLPDVRALVLLGALCAGRRAGHSRGVGTSSRAGERSGAAGGVRRLHACLRPRRSVHGAPDAAVQQTDHPGPGPAGPWEGRARVHA